LKNKIPLSLYIHLPWCLQKCHYCDFNSIAINPAKINFKDYLNALLIDLKQQLKITKSRPIHSIYIGGGTPSILSGIQIHELLSTIKNRIVTTKNPSITIEINPATITKRDLEFYQQAQINRLSIGAQSFDDKILKKINRACDSSDIIKTIKDSHNMGFDDINLDLIYGLPSQNINQALDDLKQAIDLPITHVSWYQLSIEPRTYFYKNKPQNLPNESKIIKTMDAGFNFLNKKNMKQYEISAYCKDHYQSIHNLNYWNYGDFIGIGAGAGGKITSYDKKIYRTMNQTNIKKYQNNPIATKTTALLKQQDIIVEFMMNVLRLNTGFNQKLFNERTFIEFTTIEKTVKDLINKNYLKINQDKNYTTTKKGAMLLDSIIEYFIH